ncbi:O-antigen ligase family protein [Chromobacterium violaceum]|uniref:Probable O-antigen ligase lipopolysaccharide core biosynthesis n=1 Tax=Chromobacterium violaceum (strain ATCC 12472 / DSM 30191 / JCM 1249 / CCUG 213 / NBRC 12614 / NCIMB 9131 / NCTC 9757 / MK) TaxID=243365 RepID=Q7NZV1_CHRVO|nr:O-antigen ligase family protein [Chromobacterium violaceum]AAQ58495.1 probable O-antigen ligase; lipopolysaccharide core biosynthesis [Chromobacterium violaceum ATCC 12472]MBA8734169.1 O-antigen ligase family protein [Chromobacterium violaceum]SUX39923.1 O-antigen ligase [Chromobacterium violaceum]
MRFDGAAGLAQRMPMLGRVVQAAPLALLLGCCLILTLPASGRTLFYILCSLSLLFLPLAMFQRLEAKPKALNLLLSFALLIFIGFRAAWLWYFPAPTDAGLFPVAFAYQLSNKIWLSALPLLLFPLWSPFRERLSPAGATLALVSASALLSMITLKAWYDAHGVRVGLGSLYATGAAYLLSAIHFFALLLFHPFRLKKWQWLGLCLLIALQFMSIVATGTRAALLVYLFVLGCALLWRFGLHQSWRTYAIAALLSVATLWLSWAAVGSRVKQAQADLIAYSQGNADTSLGIRFSLWDAGVHAVREQPWGQSIQARDVLFHQLVKDGALNKAALIMRDVHLHNEWLEILSLQGLPGALSWLIFLLGFGVYGWKRGGFFRRFALFYIGFWLVFGLSDVLLLSPQIAMFGAMFAALGLYLAPIFDARDERRL